MDRFMRKCIVDRKIVELLKQKRSANQIAAQLKVGKPRIRTIKKQAADKGYLSGTPLPPYPQAIFEYKEQKSESVISEADSALLANIDWIKERVDSDWHLITIFEELPLDIEISSSSFYRFLKRHQISKKAKDLRVIPEIITAPGESLQLDWGKLCDVVDSVTGKKRTLWFLVGIMGHSRYMMTRLVWSNGTEETLEAIESMFTELGGVPKKITSDNPKCFATKASKYEPILNPAFERFCSHYGVIAELLPPRDPQKKGKVERAVRYVRRLYEASEEFISIEKSQRYIDKKMAIANERKHGTTKLRPIDVLLQNEINELMPLPMNSYVIEEYHWGKVRKDGHVRFKNKYYSVDEKYTGVEVFVIGSKDNVEIFHKGELLEVHKRVTNSHQSKSTKKHHLKPHEQIMEDYDYLLDKASKIGANVKEMIESILMRGRGYVDTRAIWGIMSLNKDHQSVHVDKACRYALECGNLGYQPVIRFLNLMPSEEKNIEQSKDNKFTRDPMEYAKQLDLIQ